MADCGTLPKSMIKRFIILIILVSVPFLILPGQCPGNDSLWKRLTFLRDGSHSISNSDQLAELIRYERLINDCSFDYDSTHAFLLQRIGAMYFRQADYLKAMQYIRKSIQLITTNLGKPSVNPRFLIVDYYSLSMVNNALGLKKEKMAALDSCEILSERMQYVDPLVLFAIYQKVGYYMGTGDFHRCISYADKCSEMAIAYYSRIPGASVSMNEYISGCFVWKINALIELNDYQAAEQLLVQRERDYSKGTQNLGIIYTLLARVEVQSGKYDKAVGYFQKAFDYNRKSGFSAGCKATLSSLAYNVYFKHYRDYEKAKIIYKKALQYSNGNPETRRHDSFETLNILANIANVFVYQKQYDSASTYFQLAFDQIKPGFNEREILKSSREDFLQSEEMRYLVDLVVNKADGKQRQFDETGDLRILGEAIQIYKRADQLLDRIRAEQSEFESKLFWRDVTHHLYENAIESCFKGKDVINGFYFFERSRAVLLAEQLNERKWFGENEILTMAQVKTRIFQKRKELLTHDASSKEYFEIQNELKSDNQELDRLVDIIRAKNPVYYHGFVDTTFIDLYQIRKNLLNDHQGLVEFYSGDSAVYSILITQKEVHLNKISKAIYENLVSSYNRYISDVGLLNKEFSTFSAISRRLYQLIFQANQVPDGRIIVSPDGQYFPVEALMVNERKEYFLMNHAVSYTYSARFLLHQFENSTSFTSRDFVGIAPLTYPHNEYLPSLPGSDLSLTKVRSFFRHSNSFIGDLASKTNFLKQFSKYKIVQLYTHAMDSSLTGEPVIWFSDSALYLSELVNDERPVTNLIVLSACQTALGKHYKGEGIFSFNRGFAALGIPSSVTNLWSVDNESTYKITELFYQYLADGEPIDIALQKAKIKFLSQSSKQNSLPYFWAATILAGKSEAPRLEATHRGNLLFVLAGLIGLTVIIAWYWRRR